MSDLFSYNPAPPPGKKAPAASAHKTGKAGQNVTEFSVSDLSQSIKNTLESRFSHVRVRGEISQPRFPGSGHCYLSLKDDKSVLAAIVWRGQLSKMALTPEEGMEVIAQGRLTSFPGQSKYQLIIESLELAGQGALLKQLEQLRQKLLTEGLFAPERKQALPFLPQTIGVVTSPTGAVIRDILHRLADRFPRHVLVWPVRVQGKGSAEEIEAAIRGFSALPTRSDLARYPQAGDNQGSRIARPDLLIVARGGGSLEDLWSFNEEMVVRAVADCPIPVISAVGHETDTTLIDYVADQRAPTPTAAAEMAVPVRRDLWVNCRQLGQRAYTALMRQGQEYQACLVAMARGLPNPQRMLEENSQRLDMIDGRAKQALSYRTASMRQHLSALMPLHPSQTVARSRQDLSVLSQRLQQAMTSQLGKQQIKLSAIRVTPPKAQIQAAGQRLSYLSDLTHLSQRQIDQTRQKLADYERLLNSYSHKKILARGYAVIWSEAKRPLTTIEALQQQQGVTVEMQDGTYHLPVPSAGDQQSVAEIAKEKR